MFESALHLVRVWSLVAVLELRLIHCGEYAASPGSQLAVCSLLGSHLAHSPLVCCPLRRCQLVVPDLHVPSLRRSEDVFFGFFLCMFLLLIVVERHSVCFLLSGHSFLASCFGCLLLEEARLSLRLLLRHVIVLEQLVDLVHRNV